MIISLEWLRDYIDLPPDRSVQDIAHDLTMSTVEVEQVTELHHALAHIVVGKVAALQPLPDEDKLGIATCDIGKKNIRVVANTVNLTVGDHVAIALAGAKLRGDGGAGDKTVGIREVRGVTSEGTICAPADVGLAGLFPTEGPDFALTLDAGEAPVGSALAEVIGWRDTTLEIDNKSLTNRPDLWGHYGIARELAAIYDLTLRPAPVIRETAAPEPLVDGTFDTKICRRFYAARIHVGTMAKSPLWLRSRLIRVGQQPRNLLVDLTNYVMLDIGQPCHVYDAQTLHLPLRVRAAGDAEKLRLLDDKDYELDSSMPVIADARHCLGAAGLMGGASSAVSETTSEVILETANFDPLSVRRMASRLGLRTEASSRFEKAPDTMQIDAAQGLFNELLNRIQPSARRIGFADEHPAPTPVVKITVDIGFLQKRLGTPMTRERIKSRLESVGFAVGGKKDSLVVTVPPWRSTGDVSMQHDLLEEVARLHGYENFEYAAPRISLRKRSAQAGHFVYRDFRELLVRQGAMQEIVTYPWVTDTLLEATGMVAAAHLALAAPPAPDRSRLRPSLVPAMVGKVAENLRYHSSFRLLEIGRVFPVGEPARMDDERESLPPQPKHLCGALVGHAVEGLFVDAKGILQSAARAMRMPQLAFTAAAGPEWADENARLDVSSGTTVLGSIGVLSSRTRRLAGIKRADVVVFELSLDAAATLDFSPVAFTPIPEYPEVTVDISMLFAEAIAWADIERALQDLSPLVHTVSFVDQYRGRGVPPSFKSVTLRLILRSDARTLRSEEVAEIFELATQKLHREFGAELRGDGADAKNTNHDQ